MISSRERKGEASQGIKKTKIKTIGTTDLAVERRETFCGFPLVLLVLEALEGVGVIGIAAPRRQIVASAPVGVGGVGGGGGGLPHAPDDPLPPAAVVMAPGAERLSRRVGKRPPSYHMERVRFHRDDESKSEGDTCVMDAKL